MESHRKRVAIIACACVFMVFLALPRAQTQAFSFVSPITQYATAVAGGASYLLGNGWCLAKSFFGFSCDVPLVASAPEPESVPPTSNTVVVAQTPSAVEEINKEEKYRDVIVAEPVIHRTSPTYITNNYYTTPTVIREIVRESVEKGGLLSGKYITYDFFQKQIERTEDSQSDSRQDSFAALHDSFTTDLLTVTGLATLEDSLAVTDSVSAGSLSIGSLLDVNSLTSIVFIDGNVGIGSTSPNYELDVNGTINASSILVNGSPVGVGSGSVSSVALSAPTGFSVSGSPIITSGTLTLTYAAGYEGFLSSASTTLFGFYNTPSTRITDGTGLSWSGSTLNCDTASGSTVGCLASADWTAFNEKISSTSINTSAEFMALLGDETGSDSLVFSGSPVFTGGAQFSGIRASASSTLGFASSTALTVSGNTYLTGNVGIGTTTPYATLTIAGTMGLTGALYDRTASAGTNGMILKTTGTDVQWVATSTLGLGGGSSFTNSAQLAALLSDETGVGSAVFSGSPVFTGGAQFSGIRASASSTLGFASSTALTVSGNTYLTGNVGIGTTTPTALLALQGSSNVTNLIDVASSTGKSLFSVRTQLSTTSDHYVQGGPRDSEFSLLIQQLYTSLSANQFGSLNQPGSHAVGLLGINEDSQSTSPEFYGIVGAASNRNSTNSKTLTAGVQGEATYAGSADANGLTLLGTGGVARNDSAYNVNLMAAIYADGGQLHAGGSATLNIGVLVGDQTIGSGLNASIYTSQTAGAHNYALYNTGTAKSYFAGDIGIGTTTPTAQLTTTGTVRFSTFGAGTLQTDALGNLSLSSDERLKNIEGEFTRGIDALRLITPITYEWKESSGFDTSTLYAGFSAQNIQEAIPEAVGVGSNGFLTLSDRPILAALVNAAKEQQLMLDSLLTASSSLTTLHEGETFWTRLGTLLDGFVDGVLTLVGIDVEEVKTDTLCIGETCVDEATLKALLLNASVDQDETEVNVPDAGSNEGILDEGMEEGTVGTAETEAGGTGNEVVEDAPATVENGEEENSANEPPLIPEEIMNVPQESPVE